MVMPLDAIDGFLFKFYEKILVIPGGYHEEKLNDGGYFFEKWSAHRNIHLGFLKNCLPLAHDIILCSGIIPPNTVEQNFRGFYGWDKSMKQIYGMGLGFRV